MTKTLCDRCGEHIKKITPKTRRKLRVYSSPTTLEIRNVDLCKSCLNDLHKLIRITESYFMSHPDDAVDILERGMYYEN